VIVDWIKDGYKHSPVLTGFERYDDFNQYVSQGECKKRFLQETSLCPKDMLINK